MLSRRLLCDDRGATAVEYSLIAALIAVVVLVAIAVLGGNLLGVFQGAGNDLANPAAAVGGGTPDPCAGPSASGDPLPTCDGLTGAWSCPAGFTLTFADDEYTCRANQVQKAPYSGSVPSSPASRNFGNNGGTLSLDNVPGVVYSIASCGGRDGACAKVTLSGRQVSAGNNWDNSNDNFDYVNLTITWTVPETADTQAGLGQITVSLT